MSQQRVFIVIQSKNNAFRKKRNINNVINKANRLNYWYLLFAFIRIHKSFHIKIADSCNKLSFQFFCCGIFNTFASAICVYIMSFHLNPAWQNLIITSSSSLSKRMFSSGVTTCVLHGRTWDHPWVINSGHRLFSLWILLSILENLHSSVKNLHLFFLQTAYIGPPEFSKNKWAKSVNCVLCLHECLNVCVWQ